MIKAVILDCFGVLYLPIGEDFYRSHIKNYDKMHEQLRELDYKADMGQITQDQLIEQVAKIGNLNINEVRQNITGQYVRNQKLLDFAESLRPKIKIGLLSNINKNSIDQFFSSSERQGLFDATIISGEVGIAKPDPLIFELAAQKLVVQPAECVVIDDSQIHCAGANKAGMQAIVYQNFTQALNELKAKI